VNLPIGPDPKIYPGTKYVIDASTYNMHRTNTVQIRFIPAQNRYQAKNTIAMWISSDPDAKPPASDDAIRQQCLSARGEIFHSEFSVVKTFIVPPSTLKNFSTGQGDNSSGTQFQPQGRIFIMPLKGTDNADWNYGLTNITFHSTLSGPGTSLPATPTPSTDANNPYLPGYWHVFSTWSDVAKKAILNSTIAEYGVWVFIDAADGIEGYRKNGNFVDLPPEAVENNPTRYYIVTAPADTKPVTDFTVEHYWVSNGTDWEEKFLAHYHVKTVGPNMVTTANLIDTAGKHLPLHAIPYAQDQPLFKEDGETEISCSIRSVLTQDPTVKAITEPSTIKEILDPILIEDIISEIAVQVLNRVDIQGGNIEPVLIAGVKNFEKENKEQLEDKTQFND